MILQSTSASELCQVVGVSGFEPPVSRSRTERSSQAELHSVNWKIYWVTVVHFIFEVHAMFCPCARYHSSGGNHPMNDVTALLCDTCYTSAAVSVAPIFGSS